MESSYKCPKEIKLFKYHEHYAIAVAFTVVSVIDTTAGPVALDTAPLTVAVAAVPFELAAGTMTAEAGMLVC